MQSATTDARASAHQPKEPLDDASSEISEEEQEKMGLSEGLIRFSVGLDQDISRTYEGINKCLKEFNLI